MRDVSLAVVGVQHSPKRGPTRQFAIHLCAPGDPVDLRREPTNPADEHAVAVFNAQGMQMGYLTADRAPWIGGMLLKSRSINAVFQQGTEYGAVIRVAFDGTLPRLPARRHAPTPPQDFWPDEEWSDQ